MTITYIIGAVRAPENQVLDALDTLENSALHPYARLLHRVAEGRLGYESSAAFGEPGIIEEYRCRGICHATGPNFWGFEGVVEHFEHFSRLVGWLSEYDSDGEEIDSYPYERRF